MVRRRTAVSIAAAGLVLASPVLTACGSGPAHQGAAAVVGDHRITIAGLQSQVDEVRSAEAKDPQAGAQAVSASGSLSTQTLSMLVQNEVIDRAAADAGVKVTDAEVQQERAAALQQFNGDEKQLDSTLLTRYGVGPSGIDQFFRTNVTVGKLIASLGFQPGSDNGNAAALQTIAKTAKSIGVTVNPRYGTWDAKKAVIGASTDPWVVNRTATAAAADTEFSTGS